MIGGVFALKVKSALPIAMGFSAGAVIGLAFFDLAPEALDAGKGAFDPRTLLTVVAVGFFLYAVLDRLMSPKAYRPTTGLARGILGAASFSVHSILDGFMLGVAFQANREIGLVVTAAVLSHDFADGLNTVTIVMKNSGARSSAMRWLAIDAVAPIVGACLSLLVAPGIHLLAFLLALFCGFFLYIGASELLPESHRNHPQPTTTLATLTGAAFLYAVTTLVT